MSQSHPPKRVNLRTVLDPVMNVHPTDVIDPRARVPASCKIGPYCVIGPEVELGEGCHLVSHVAIEGPT